ncbi:MAG: phosphoribosylglycinamide formyltransferase [Gammaproteobacteria bacterium]|nr:phosphoribosylglycinamide formyltransferase [Gammaproteobacteria bacterium]
METPRCRIVVLISGNGSNLQALIDSSRASNFKIVAVISNKPEAYGLQRAKHEDIPTQIIDHTTFESRTKFDKALADTVEDINPELIVLAGFMRILGNSFVMRFKGRILNIHPSLLPKFPGTNTHKRAIDSGDKEHGVSVHFVTSELDGGPLIAQEKVPVLKDDTPQALAARVLEKEHIIYPKVVSWFASGRLKMKNNDAMLDDEKLLLSNVLIQSQK